MLILMVAKMNKLLKFAVSLEETMKPWLQELYDEINNPNPDRPYDVWEDDYPEEVEELAAPSVSDLINDIGDMWTYFNRSGRSNIKAYKYGPDWILIEFGGEVYYLYTIKSVTRVQLDDMKHFADGGSGLNSYINKNVRGGYVAKNINNQVILTTGFETYVTSNPSIFIHIGNKMNSIKDYNVVTSLEAYKTAINQAGVSGLTKESQNLIKMGLSVIDQQIGFKTVSTEDSSNVTGDSITKRIEFIERVSNEGLFELVRDLLVKDDTPVAKPVTKTTTDYLRWFTDNRNKPLVFGVVNKPSEKISSFFTGNDPLKTLENGLSVYGKLFTTLKTGVAKAERYKNDTEKKLSKYIGNVDHLEEFKKDFKAIVNAQPPLMGDALKSVSFNLPGYGDVKLARPDGFIQFSVPDTIPNQLDRLEALDAAKSKAYLNLAGKYLDLWVKLSDMADDMEVGLDATDPPYRGYNDDEEVQDLTNQFEYLDPTYDEKGSNAVYLVKTMIWNTFESIVAYAQTASNEGD